MRDPKRIEPFLKQFKALWKKNPDMRFFQLVECLRAELVTKDGDAFYVEDGLTAEAIQLLMESW